MPFNSNTARIAGKKSKRGKAKYTTEIREKLNILTDNLVSDLNIQKLNTNEKIALLEIAKCPDISSGELNSINSEYVIKNLDFGIDITPFSKLKKIF